MVALSEALRHILLPLSWESVDTCLSHPDNRGACCRVRDGGRATKTRDVVSGSEYEDLTFGGFGGVIWDESSTDLVWWSYDLVLSGCSAIPFPDGPPRPLASGTACSRSFPQLAAGSPNPVYSFQLSVLGCGFFSPQNFCILFGIILSYNSY